jgi:iron complex outermembrane receptor protein
MTAAPVPRRPSRALPAAPAFAAALGLPLLAAAQQADVTEPGPPSAPGSDGSAAEPIALAPIDVSAEAEAAPAAVADNPSRFVEVVRAEPAREQARSAADLVEDLAGVRVRRYGGLGSFATMSIRGSSPAQVPVLLDGVPLADARSGIVNLEELATADLERIEVYRGFAPAALAEAGIGGAVNLVTRAAPSSGDPELSSGLSGGSFATWRAWASGAAALDDDAEAGAAPGVRLSFGCLRTAGDYRFASDNGTPEEPSDDVVLERRNNDYAQLSASARAAVPLDGWSADASAAVVSTDQGLPGLDYDQAERARLGATDARLRLAAAIPDLADGLLSLEGSAWGRLRVDRFADPLGEIGVGRQVEDDRSAGVGAALQATAVLGDGRHLVRARLAAGHEAFRASYELPAPSAGPDQLRWSLEVAGGYEVSLADDALVLLADARLDVDGDRFSGDPCFEAPADGTEGTSWDVLVSPSGGLRWTIVDGLDLKANVGWFHRVPSFAELFGDRGTVVGNPDLRAESAANVDAGVAAAFGSRDDGLRLAVDCAFFGSFAADLIVFVPQSQNVFRAENIGSARTLGAEATLRAAWDRFAELDVRYTFQDARDAGDTPYWSGLPLPGRSPHDLSARLLGRYRLLEAWYELDFVSETALDRANLRSVPSRVLHGAGIGVRWRTPQFEMSATAEGRNLADAWVYDAFRYPLPGRSFFATFVVRI